MSNEEKMVEQNKLSLPNNPIKLAGIALIIIGIVLTIYFMFSNKSSQEINPKEHLTINQTSSLIGKIFYFDLQDMLINLVSTNKKGNYLKISISVEFSDPHSLDKLKALKPRLTDQYQVFLRSLRVEELRGSSGLERIREELLRRTNLIMAPEKVTNILFREIVVQ